MGNYYFGKILIYEKILLFKIYPNKTRSAKTNLKLNVEISIIKKNLKIYSITSERSKNKNKNENKKMK